MLDVHVPHATHTWKDFFIHIATICVGLLIAISLEQAVEAIHRHLERQELREALQKETEQIRYDTTDVETTASSDIAWLKQEDEILDIAVTNKHALGKFPEYPVTGFEIPDDPVYKAAKSGNKLGLLTQQEVQAYGEMDGLIILNLRGYDVMQDDAKEFHLVQSEISFRQIGQTAPQGISRSRRGWAAFTGMTLPLADLRQMRSTSERMELSSEVFRSESRLMRGAAVVMLKGERDLRKIQAAENQFDNLP